MVHMHFSIGLQQERERRLIFKGDPERFDRMEKQIAELREQNEQLNTNLDAMNKYLQSIAEAQKVAAIGPTVGRAVPLPQAGKAMRERVIERYQGEKPSSFDQQPPLTRTRYSSEIGCYREHFDRQSNRWVKGEIIKSAQEVHDHGTQRMMEREQHFAQEKARFDRAGIVLKGYNQNRRSIANQNWQQQQRVDAAFASVGGRPEMPPPNVLPPPPQSALQPRGGFAFSRPASRFPTEADMKLTPEEEARLPELDKRFPPSARQVELDRALNEVDKRMAKTAKDRGLSSREFVEMKDGRSLLGDKIGDLEHTSTSQILVRGPGGASPSVILIESRKPNEPVRSFGFRVNKFTGTLDDTPENRRAIEYMKSEGLSAKIQKRTGGYDVIVYAHKKGNWNIRAMDRADRWADSVALKGKKDGELIVHQKKEKPKKRDIKKEDDLLASVDPTSKPRADEPSLKPKNEEKKEEPQKPEAKPEVKPAIPEWMTKDLKDIRGDLKNDVLKIVSDLKISPDKSHVTMVLHDKAKLVSGLEYLNGGGSDSIGIKNAKIVRDALEIDVDPVQFWKERNLNFAMGMVIMF